MLSLPLLTEALQLDNICGTFGDNTMESVLEMQIIVDIMNRYNLHFLQHYSLFYAIFFIFMTFVYLCASKINKKIY